MLFKKEKMDFKRGNKEILDKEILEYEKCYEDLSRMELKHNINKLLGDFKSIWKNICDEYNSKYNNNTFELVLYNFFEQQHYEFNNIECLYDLSYENDPKFCDNIIVDKCGVEAIAKYRALVNVYRKIRPLSEYEESCLNEEEKKYREELKELPNEERPDIVWCPKSRWRELTNKTINNELYLIINSIKNLEPQIVINNISQIDQYPGLKTYLILMLFDCIDLYPETKVIGSREYDLDFLCGKMIEGLSMLGSINYLEFDLNQMLINYSMSKRKKYYEKIIIKLHEMEKEKFEEKIISAILSQLENATMKYADIKHIIDLINAENKIRSRIYTMKFMAYA